MSEHDCIKSPKITEHHDKLFRRLGKLSSYQMQKPFALFTPRRISLPLLSRVKAEFIQVEQIGEISRMDTQTVCRHGNGPKTKRQIHICVDLTKLIEDVRRVWRTLLHGTYPRITQWSKILLKLGCSVRILTDTTCCRISTVNHLPHTFWKALFQLITF